jgi:hypothetical protein
VRARTLHASFASVDGAAIDSNSRVAGRALRSRVAAPPITFAFLQHPLWRTDERMDECRRLRDWPHALVVTLLVCCTACGSSGDDGATHAGTSTGDDTGSTSSGVDASTTINDDGASTTSAGDDASTSSSSSGSSDGGASTSDTGTGGDSGMLYEVDVSQSPCFELATGTANADNPCANGDLYFLSGFNVDLDSANQAEPAYCVTGEAAGLDDVPSDYAACSWQGYIEGADGLANTGYVVRDRLGAHHYRMQIVSNTLPVLTFHFDAID